MAKLAIVDVNGNEIIQPTNEEFVSWLMNFSPYGAICQSVIIEAIRYYTEKVSENPAPEDDEKAFINPAVWHACCTDIHNKIKANYE